MITFIYSISNLQLFILIFSILFVTSIIGFFIFKYFISGDLARQGLDGMNNIKSTINPIYAMIIGFTLFYSFGKFNNAQIISEHESMVIMSIYNNASWLPEPFKSNIIIDLQKYTTAVIHNEWPLMQAGVEINDLVNVNLKDINDQLQIYNAKNLNQPFIIKNIFDLLQDLDSTRNQRLNMDSTAVFPEFWYVLFTITFVVLIISYFSNLKLHFHLFLTASFVLAISATIFLLIIIDRPFRGEFSVKPTAFQNVLKIINNDPIIINYKP